MRVIEKEHFDFARCDESEGEIIEKLYQTFKKPF
jgi:hypothetical protein